MAKITDFGNSRIVNIQPGQLAQMLSRNPGTLVYMPPEALTAAARYGPGLDIFSFGHLAIFVGLQVCARACFLPDSKSVSVPVYVCMCMCMWCVLWFVPHPFSVYTHQAALFVIGIS